MTVQTKPSGWLERLLFFGEPFSLVFPMAGCDLHGKKPKNENQTDTQDHGSQDFLSALKVSRFQLHG